MATARSTTAALLLTLALLAASCDSSPAAETTTAGVDQTSTTAPATSTTAIALPPVDRLLVLDQDGNVLTMDRDGSNVATLTEDGGVESGYFQPTWSPLADSVAVTRFNATGFSVVKFDLETGDETEIPTENNAFYIYWSPDGERLAYLSNGATSLTLRIADFVEGTGDEEIDLGQPFYFDWSPGGEELATLIAGARFDVRSATSNAETTAIADPGAFQNPVWTDAGLLYVTTVGGTDQLVLGTPGGDSRSLVVINAPAIITAPSAGHRVAIQAIGTVDGVSASFQETPRLPLNRLVVIDTATGELTQVTDTPVLAYFWDPPGDQLLVLDDNPDNRQLRWSVWSDGELRRLTDFRPSGAFVNNFLPFFGQYALSTTMWAPDGSAFAFTGLVGDKGGVYVQDVAGGEPVFVAQGDWVTWSPR